jgi:hypothetical protein
VVVAVVVVAAPTKILAVPAVAAWASSGKARAVQAAREVTPVQVAAAVLAVLPAATAITPATELRVVYMAAAQVEVLGPTVMAAMAIAALSASFGPATCANTHRRSQAIFERTQWKNKT